MLTCGAAAFPSPRAADTVGVEMTRAKSVYFAIRESVELSPVFTRLAISEIRAKLHAFTAQIEARAIFRSMPKNVVCVEVCSALGIRNKNETRRAPRPSVSGTDFTYSR